MPLEPDFIQFEIKGTAAPQGSKSPGKVIAGRSTMRESSKALKPWRKNVIDAAKFAAGPGWHPLDGALIATLNVYFSRPRNSKFKDYPAGAPDLDKLQRAIGDALTLAGIIHDDARIVTWVATKRWTDGQPFAAVRVQKHN